MATAGTESESFLAGLFDFSFTSFVTLRFLKVIYALLMGLILLGGLGFLGRGLSEGGVTALAALVLVPIVTLLYLVFARVGLELVAVVFRIGENTTLLVRQQGGPGAVPTAGPDDGPPAGPPAGPWGGPTT